MPSTEKCSVRAGNTTSFDAHQDATLQQATDQVTDCRSPSPRRMRPVRAAGSNTTGRRTSAISAKGLSSPVSPAGREQIQVGGDRYQNVPQFASPLSTSASSRGIGAVTSQLVADPCGSASTRTDDRSAAGDGRRSAGGSGRHYGRCIRARDSRSGWFHKSGTRPRTMIREMWQAPFAGRRPGEPTISSARRGRRNTRRLGRLPARRMSSRCSVSMPFPAAHWLACICGPAIRSSLRTPR